MPLCFELTFPKIIRCYCSFVLCTENVARNMDMYNVRIYVDCRVCTAHTLQMNVGYLLFAISKLNAHIHVPLTHRRQLIPSSELRVKRKCVFYVFILSLFFSSARSAVRSEIETVKRQATDKVMKRR